ncbi:Lipase GDSL domain-containing protein [Citrus sinensis]|uniref:Lipase GDSL domain-containing protein n=1 Tax=Citrus sinensis TaxID=2711 RepID=A0ACB8LKZ0_CITSI|nr:Lipase GDSL domain-containing protein [Citrus sinensis]
MVSSAALFNINIILSTIIKMSSVFLLPRALSVSEPRCPIEAIYQFGDSISDTGNQIRDHPVLYYAARLPYGQTYFHDKPTGRWSDGLLMIDYIAMDLKLPLLNPYLDKNTSFNNGVNFAVAASTALDDWFFAARNIPVKWANNNAPLKVQLNWFKTYLNSSVCQSNTDCARKLRRSIVILETGSNDYSYALFQGKSIQEVQTYIRDIVGAIVDAVREVIRLGAIRVVVTGTLPEGCCPIFLAAFPNSDPKAYDDKGCLRDLNEKGALAKLRPEFPHADIIYADYYAAFLSVLRRAESLGFEPRSTLKACCGTGGLYNFDKNLTKVCGAPGVPVCPNPDQHISWDGTHLTQNVNCHMSEFLINDTLSRIRCTQ